MKFITWNVNGIRACMNKGFLNFVNANNPDFMCIQETKMQVGQAEVPLNGYAQFWNSAEKKGYSGTAIFTKHKPISAKNGIDDEKHENEGRSITLEYENFYLVTEYTPNSQNKLARLDYRLDWEKSRREYLKKLDSKKPVILCGDLNVAHNEIDLKNPKTNRQNAGFSDEERSAFTALLAEGFTDTFRYLYPDVTGAYTWWSYMGNARKNNAGWRIDYFVVSNRIADKIKDVIQLPEVLGSDHCPVILDIDI
ncbi:MAG: exodeoxyribonuclease III [Clostridiales bacterium]|nr:exodeoxyribonuclease III [Clostridiales bacterium]